MNEDGEVCQRCQARAQAAKDEKARNKGKTMRKVKEVLKEDREPEEKGQPTAAGPTETSIPAEEPGPSEIFPVGSLPQELPVSPFSVPRNKTPLPDVSTGAIIAPQLLSILPHINTPNISHKYTTETEIEPLDITEKTEDSHVQKTAESSPNSSAVESTLNTTD